MWRGLSPAVFLGLIAIACSAPPAAPSGAPDAARGSPAGPAPAGAEAAPPAPRTTVRLGLLMTLADAGVFIALDRGYFAEEGLEIEATRIDGAAQAIPHLATGQLDAAGITPNAGFFNAVARGLPLRIAGDKGRLAPGRSAGMWVLREDVAASGVVQDWADLRGLTLGINVPNTGTSTDIILDRTLERAGLTREDVHIVGVSYPDINTAFANRTIEAAYHTEPFLTLGENQGLLRRWRSAADIVPDLHTTVWIYSPGFAATEAAFRFMVGYLRGARDFTDAFVYGWGKPAVVEILTRYTPVKDARLYDQMGFAALDPNGRVIPERIAEDVQYYLAKGYLQQPVDVAQVIDLRYADHAVSRLGPYRPPAP
jgi:NitT/TauT family transport system substrate-binding protein